MATNPITASHITNDKTLLQHGALHIRSRNRSHRHFRLLARSVWKSNQPHFFFGRAAGFVDPVNPTDTPTTTARTQRRQSGCLGRNNNCKSYNLPYLVGSFVFNFTFPALAKLSILCETSLCANKIREPDTYGAHLTTHKFDHQSHYHHTHHFRPLPFLTLALWRKQKLRQLNWSTIYYQKSLPTPQRPNSNFDSSTWSVCFDPYLGIRTPSVR